MADRLDRSKLEDLSNYLVSVMAKRPADWKHCRTDLFRCETRYNDGDFFALYDALLNCERGCLPLPNWLVAALKNHLVSTCTGHNSGKVGRNNSELGRSRQQLREQVHYRTVKTVLRISSLIPGEDLIARFAGPRSLRHQFPSMLWEKIEDPNTDLSVDDFRANLTKAYATASKILRGTFAQAEARTIRLNYRRISNGLERGELVLPHSVDWFPEVDPETLDAFGLQFEMTEAEMAAFHSGTQLLDPEPEFPEAHRETFDFGEDWPEEP